EAICSPPAGAIGNHRDHHDAMTGTLTAGRPPARANPPQAGPAWPIRGVLRLPNPYAVPVVSVEVAGQLVGMSRATAYRAAAQDDLPTIPLAGQRGVPPAAL